MAAVAATTTQSVITAGVAIAGAGTAVAVGSGFLLGMGVAIAFTPAFFLAPGLIAAASVPITGAEISMDQPLESNPHELQASLDSELIQLNMETDYLG